MVSTIANNSAYSNYNLDYELYNGVQTNPINANANANVFSNNNITNNTSEYSTTSFTNEKADEETLQEQYENIKKEQGFAGKTWNWIKNKIPFLEKFGFVGSDKIEEILKQVESGEITEEEAQEILDNYATNQEKGKNTLLNIGTVAIVTGALLLAGPLGWGTLAVLAVATAVGCASRVALGAADAATNEVENDYTKEDFKDDATTGSLIGFAAGLGKILGCKVKTPSIEDIENTTELVNTGNIIASSIKGIL